MNQTLHPREPSIQAYLINLARAPERRHRMHRMLTSVGIEYELIAAVDGAAQEPETLKAVTRAAPGYSPSAGQLGCFLSHREAWRRIAEGAAPYGLILEDDLILATNFGDLIRSFQANDLDADIVRLEGWPGRFWARKPVADAGLGYSLVRLEWDAFGTGAYLISKGCAARLLSDAVYYTHPIDIMLFNEQSLLYSKLRTLVAIPAPSFQHAFYDGAKDDTDFLASSIVPITSGIKAKKGALKKLSDEFVRLGKRMSGWRRVSIPLHPSGPLQTPTVRPLP